MMNEYQVDSGVPVPRGKTGGKYPWSRMKDGDSFFVPKKKGRTARDAGNTAQMSGRAWLRRNQINQVRVAVRVTKEDGVEGARIWFVRDGR